MTVPIGVIEESGPDSKEDFLREAIIYAMTSFWLLLRQFYLKAGIVVSF